MRAQTILFLSVDGVKEKLDCRPYRGRGEGNPKRLVEAASRAFSNRSSFLTLRALVAGKAKAHGVASRVTDTLAALVDYSGASTDHFTSAIEPLIKLL